MVKKLKIFPVIILLSFTSFSQKDTSKIYLPYHVAKLIAIDLVQGDSVRAELKQTKEILSTTQDKIKVQDTVIMFYEKKEIEHKAEIKIFEQKEKTNNDNIKDLKEKNATLEQKNGNLRAATHWLGGGLIATLTTLIALLSFK